MRTVQAKCGSPTPRGPALYPLTNAIRQYAWGSHTHIPRILGAEPTTEPAAEMWIGAHPGDSSRLPDGQTLAAAIDFEPDDLLGPRVERMFGPRLPYLMKLLAAAEPLSLQVHPTSERARIGYAEEQAARIPLSAPERRYHDPSHKPELIFALTRFEGMAGFRDCHKTAEILRRLELPWCDEMAARLAGSQAPYQTLKALVTEMLAMSGEALRERLVELREAAVRAEADSHRADPRLRPPLTDPSSVEREATRLFAQTAALTARYPHDPGVLVTLLLNHVVLAAGDAMFIDAGVLHAYTSGFGVEVMAASDNVLRAGLTPKHVDVAELLEITNFTPSPPPLWASTTTAGSEVERFTPPVTEFALTVGPAAGCEISDHGPRIVLALEGPVTVAAGDKVETLASGHAVFVAHEDGAVTLSGAGRVAVVSVPG
jgi:mannose-6-phosphate isomerase